MDYKFNTDEFFRAHVNLTINMEEYKKFYSSVLNYYKKNAKIDGFRPGKVPLSIIEKKFSKEIEEETMNKLLPEKLEEVLKKEEKIPLSRPIVMKIDKNEDNINVEIEFDIYPEIEIKGYDRIEIDVKREITDDKAVNDEIERFRNHYAQTEETDKELEEGDIAIIDFNVFDKDNNELEELAVKDYSVEIGSQRVFKEIDEALKNHKVGDKIEVPFKYPEDFQDEKLRNKEVLFKIIIKKTYKKNLPELNEEFAKNFSMNNMEQLRTAVKANLENRSKNEYNAKVDEEIINYIIEKNKFNAPKTLYQMHLNSILKPFAQKDDIEITDEIRKLYGPYAEWRAKREIILSAIIKQENIKVDKEEVQGEIVKLKNSADAKWRKYAESEEAFHDIELDIMFKKAMELLRKNTFVNNEPLINNEEESKEENQNNKGGE